MCREQLIGLGLNILFMQHSHVWADFHERRFIWIWKILTWKQEKYLLSEPLCFDQADTNISENETVLIIVYKEAEIKLASS